MTAKLPTKVRLLGHDWTVTTPSELMDAEELRGQTLHLEHTFRINAHRPTSGQREALLHELIHAVTSELLSPGDDLTEAQVRVVAAGLFQVAADNPKAWQFIGGS